MKYIISAGGTGGHIYPALEIANELTSKGHEVLFFATNKKLDKKIINRETIGFTVKYKRLSGFKRKLTIANVIKNFFNLFFLLYLLIYSFFVILKFKPTYIIGFGGYITFPFVYMGSILNKKTAIHEQNSYPGLVNKKLSNKVDKVFYTFESSLKYLKGESEKIYTSNPRINAVLEVIQKTSIDKYSAKSVLFIGGSLGAKKINDIALQFGKEYKDINVMIVTGERYYDEFKKQQVPENVMPIKYLDDPVSCFMCSDVVVTRSGASTILELMACKTLSIFIPSPNVVADHQTINAKEFVDKKMATMIDENDLSFSLLKSTYNSMIENEKYYKDNMDKFELVDSKKLITKEING